MHRHYHHRSIGRTLCLSLFVAAPWLLTGCTASFEARRGEQAIDRGELVSGLQRLQRNAQEYPRHSGAQTTYYLNRDAVLGRLSNDADQARNKGDFGAALSAYQVILSLDPQNARATQGLRELEKRQRHGDWMAEAEKALEAGQDAQAQRWLQEILAENPNDGRARDLLMALRTREQQEARMPPALKHSFRKPVSLELRQVPIQSVLELLSQSSGLSFILDTSIRTDERVTLFARNTTVEDSLNLLMATNSLAYKVLNDSTLLIYPATPEKRKKYGDLVIKTIPIGNGNPKVFADMIKSFVKTAEVFSDDKLKTLVVRDTQDNISVIERLLAANDVADAEVMLEIEILEINTDKLANIGIQYPTQAKASVIASNRVPGVIPLPEFSDLTRKNLLVTLGDPLAIVNLKYTDGVANTLANPRIRVRNREKAKVLIGDKVPVITTTNNTTSGTVSESISYLDVGLKLEVEPDIDISNDVNMNVSLEVSDIVKEITSTTGLVTYQIGTRNASTALRLHDGETQALAGLIRREDKESASRVPGLGNLPLLGRLFSNESRTRKRSELVLLITPHVVRSRALPDSSDSEILVGSEDNPGRMLRLRNGARTGSNSGVLGKGQSPRKAAPAAVASAAATPSASPTNAPSAELAPPSPGELPSPADSAAPAGDDAQEAPPAVLFDPSLAKIRLNLVAPGQVKVGQDFTLALMASSTESFRDLELALQLPADMELVRTTAGTGLQLQSRLQDKTLTLTATNSEPRLINGPLALLTLRAKAPAADGRLSAAVQKAQGADAQDLLVSTGEPRPLAVLP